MTPIQIFTNLPIKRKLLLVSALPILAVLCLSMLTYKSVQTFSDDEDRLNQVYHIQSASAEYMRLVVDIETGFRGYVLTEQPQFLKPYKAAKTRVYMVGRSLKQMVQKDFAQSALIDKTQRLIQELIADKDRLIERVKLGHTEEAIKYIENEEGRFLMLGIREGMALFDGNQIRILLQALSKSAGDRSILLAIVTGGGILALVSMVLPLPLIARSITGPLIELSKSMGNTSGGAVPNVPVVDRADEIGDLTRAIHAMSTQLREHFTRLQQSENELRMLNMNLAESEAKYRGIVDHAPIGIFAIQENRFIFNSPQNWILAGRDPEEELDPELLWDAVHPEDLEAVRHVFASAATREMPFEKIFRFLHPNGEVRKVLSRAIPIKHGDELPTVYQGFNVDITALEQMRAQLSRSKRLATLGQVAAGIAHEIRNPLVGIGSTTSLLLEDFSKQDQRRNDLTTVLQETRRLDRIVNQIVDFAKPRDLLPVSFAIEEIIEESLELLYELRKAKKILVSWHRCDQSHFLQADRDQIKQVLLNTIQNAIEAMGLGGKLQITVEEAHRQEEKGLTINIKDDGKGIEPEDLPRIFEPFFTAGKRRGTGLGLAICQNIVDAHGGDLLVRSQSGEGSNVSIWLPLVQHSEFQTA